LPKEVRKIHRIEHALQRGALWKGVKGQDQVPGGFVVADGNDYIVTVKTAVEERPTPSNSKQIKTVGAPSRYYSLIEPGAA
jgi:hypothetical protein